MGILQRMQAWQIILIVAVVCGIVTGVVLSMKDERARTDEPKSGPKSKPKSSAKVNPTTLEERLAFLETCGLKLAAPFKAADLLESWPREEYEDGTWDTVLVGLGMEHESEPGGNHCVSLWHFDTECIEDHGDYARIAARMAEMAEGSLPLKEIRDVVDVEEGKAEFSFTLNGKPHTITCEVDDDWVDPGVFQHFVELLGETDPSKVFIYFDLGGQDCILGCVTKEQLERLQSAGIAFEPLN
ncbi:MAG: hypothetical protein QNJ90_15370 [Planctomycetota bacterium]|nr:hypothetical protein [Planctomycetota bacterium]